MKKLVTAENMKQLDGIAVSNYGIKASVLMENAGKSLFEAIRKYENNDLKKKFVLICGMGNNGGDGFVAARHLVKAGADVSVFVTGPKTSVSKEAKGALLKLEKVLKKIVSLKSADSIEIKSTDIVVDAIFGTGFNSNPEGIFYDIIKLINSSGAKVYSADIPSCVHGTTGFSEDIAVIADHTVTFGFPKIGLHLNDGYSHSGTVDVADIGFPADLNEEILDTRMLLDISDAFGIFKERELMSDKKDYGKIFNFAGSLSMPGAAVMSSVSALRTGTGLIKLGIPMNISASVSAVHPEIMCIPLGYSQPGYTSMAAEKDVMKGHRWCDACLIGPGLSVHPETKKVIKKLIQKLNGKPSVLDADALNTLSESTDMLKNFNNNIVITPHDSEMARLCQTDKELFLLNRLELCVQKAVEWKCYILLKGTPTIIAHPDGRAFLHINKNPAMAVGGMGDVLSGILVSLIGQKVPIPKAIIGAVYIHALAAQAATEKLGQDSLLPTDVIKEIPGAIMSIRRLEKEMTAENI